MKNLVQCRRGQILILAAVMALVLGAIAMLSIDVGYVFTHRAIMQNASDAAALAALQVLASEREDGASEAEARCAAVSEAAAIAEANAAGAAVEVAFGLMAEGMAFTELSSDTIPATAVRVVVARDADATGGPINLFFGPLFGFDALTVSASAFASLSTDICGVRANLAPFAVYEGDVVAPGQTMTFYPGDSDDMAPGCFGLLNLDGGSFGTPEVTDWILNGYDKEIRIDPTTGYLWVDGGTGFRSAIKSAVEQRIGDEMIVCVYDQVTGTGHNADFRVISFMALTITDCRLTGNNKYIEGRVEDLTATGDVIAGESGTESPNLARVRLVG